MPSIVGNLKINSVSQGSNVQIGDTAFVALSSSSKNYGGAAAFSPGDSFGAVANNQASSTNTLDPDVVDGSSATVV
ncbi:putative spore germination protein GerPA [Paenibacillus konkukensis]|uniref:Spore germination protein GerPA n=1 Tax=Paenibacillus konkukensis TaxID=2020716 RepID=A0ABY4RN22_9BACL|nr:spore germination protein [Paenibacillus konkukensis]UQZ83874.1 putative spore germination protein GerPA [Paenibacillus konkukensis]